MEVLWEGRAGRGTFRVLIGDWSPHLFVERLNETGEWEQIGAQHLGDLALFIEAAHEEWALTQQRHKEVARACFVRSVHP